MSTPPGRRTPETTVELCPDGPMLVRGPAEIVGEDGVPVPRRRGTVAVCRCKGTRIPPWCDGTHRLLAARRTAVVEG